MATFTFVPSISSASKTKTRIKKVQFGDGYMQRGSDGINAVKKDWDLVFTNITDANADAIEAFLSANVGAAITWTPPGAGASSKYTCTEWKRTYAFFNVCNLTVPFEQVFE